MPGFTDRFNIVLACEHKNCAAKGYHLLYYSIFSICDGITFVVEHVISRLTTHLHHALVNLVTNAQ